MTTLTIMRILPREVDPLVYNMSTEDPGNISFAGIGGLSEQIRELREVHLLKLNFRLLNYLYLILNYSLELESSPQKGFYSMALQELVKLYWREQSRQLLNVIF
jgi:hypothetical protein